MKILVCGGRNYEGKDYVDEVLGRYHRERRISLIIQGGANGADLLARIWAMDSGVNHNTYLPNWKIHGIKAGPKRNLQMLREGKPDLVIAFPGGKGTADMVRQTKRWGTRLMQIH